MKRTFRQWIVPLVLLAGGSIYFVTQQFFGQSIAEHSFSPSVQPDAAPFRNESVDFSLMVLQIAVIVTVAGFCGKIANRSGQPAVVGEMIAGILLGPSVLGWLLPQVSGFIFAPPGLPFLKMISQLAMVVFMFGTGLEFDGGMLKSKLKSALVISQASLLVPFICGAVMALFLYSRYSFSGVPLTTFALFIGTAISVTAFPVLACIIEEKGLRHTRLGMLALTVAATSDVFAWLLLALVLSLAKKGTADAFGQMLAGIGIFLTALFVVVKLLFPPFVKRYKAGRVSFQSATVIAFLFLLLTVYGAEKIGLHALIGGFVAGVLIPYDKKFKKKLHRSLQSISILLPLFFVFTGLNTRLFILVDSNLWVTCLFIVFIAVASKLLSTALAARLAGEPLYESVALGALVNTRGLMELAVLSIGYDAGILDARLFTMMVLMTVITTCMTGPMLKWVERLTGTTNRREPEKGLQAVAGQT